MPKPGEGREVDGVANGETPQVPKVVSRFTTRVPGGTRIETPRLTNRGPAGLYGKVVHVDGQTVPDVISPPSSTQEIDKVLNHEDVEVVDISLLNLDPNNARLHPERNMESIRLSLSRYGQRKTVVVRKSDMLVIAGNGTVEAARQLGWTKITVAWWHQDSDVELAGYGIADNRTAELATWDMETLKKLGRLQQESQGCLPGWSLGEIEAMRIEAEVILISKREAGPPPSEFPEIDETLTTTCKCPKCGFAWSGDVVLNKKSKKRS